MRGHCQLWTEINLVEVPAGIDDYRGALVTNVHVHRSPNVSAHWSSPRRWQGQHDISQDYHVFGLEWDEDFIKWYVDGNLIRTEANVHWHQPLYININNEANPWFRALPDDNRLPETYHIRYVRTWKRVPSAFRAISPLERATAVDPVDTVFKWEPASQALGYRLIIAEDPDFVGIVVDRQVECVETVVRELKYNSTYYWKVAAWNAVTDGYVWNANGPQRLQTIALNVPPLAPEAVTVRSGVEQVLLTWDMVPLADGYAVYRLQDTGAEQILAFLPRHQTHYLDPSVIVGEGYRYSIRAINSLGESPAYASERIEVLPAQAVISEHAFDSFPEDWMRRGSWSLVEIDGRRVINLRAVFPSAFGSLRIAGLDRAASHALNLRFRIREIDNPDFASMRISAGRSTAERYQLFYSVKDKGFMLESRVAGDISTIGVAGFEVERDVWYELELVIVHQLVRLYLDGVLVVQAFLADSPVIQEFELVISSLDVDFDRLSWNHD